MSESLTGREDLAWPRVVGSLVGFDTVDTPTDPTNLSESGWSRMQLVEFLLNLYDKIGPSGMRKLRQQILNHIHNYNNPHQDDLSGMADDIINRLLNNITSGTIPRTYPTYSLAPDLELGITLLGLAVSRASPIYVINRAGMLTLLDVNVLAVDWASGTATIPCWGAYNRLRPNMNWSDTSESPVNTSAVQATGARYDMPLAGGTYMTISETGVVEEFGLTSTFTRDQAGPCTWSCFLRPGRRNGYAAVSIDQFSDAPILVSLVDGTILGKNYSDSMIVYGERIPGGWVRVGVHFVAAAQDYTVRVAHLLTDDLLADDPNALTLGENSQVPFVIPASATTRQGIVGSVCFDACIFQITDTAGMAPVIPDGQSSVAATTITVSDAGGEFPTSEMMGDVGILTYGSLAPLSETVCTIGPITIENLGSSLKTTCNLNDKPYFSSLPITAEQLTVAAFSQNAQQYRSKFSDKDCDTYNGAFTIAEPFDTLTIGPFSGAISEVVLYRLSDVSSDLEFLTNG